VDESGRAVNVKASFDLSADGARTIVRQVVDRAGGAHRSVSVAVVDSAGVMVAFERMDGALRFSADLALGKARTAAAFGRATAQMEAAFRDRPVFAQSFVHQGGWYLGRGGFPLLVNGRPAGGVGVSGDDAEFEEGLAFDAAQWFQGHTGD
jgi:uncharacterized protein GlcG (DUF336 family)